MNPKTHQQEVCDEVICLMGKCKNESLQIVEIPDKVERKKKAVDLHVRDSATNKEYHIEHTLIESFSGQITDGIRFTDLLVPIEKLVEGKLPKGHFYFSVATGAIAGATDSKKIQGILEKWIIEKAPALSAEASKTRSNRQVKGIVPGLSFEVILGCDPNLEDCFYVARYFTSEKLEEERRKRIRIALDTKCPKLKEAKLKNGSSSVLVLESDDIALANHHLIAAALMSELNERSNDIPDAIYLVKTEIPEQWTIWILKEGDNRFPNAPLSVPHYIRRSKHGGQTNEKII